VVEGNGDPLGRSLDHGSHGSLVWMESCNFKLEDYVHATCTETLCQDKDDI